VYFFQELTIEQVSIDGIFTASDTGSFVIATAHSRCQFNAAVRFSEIRGILIMLTIVVFR
jgi:hypothetical protein